MKKVTTIQFSIEKQKFDTEPLDILLLDEKTRYDLTDIFETLSANSGYKSLSTMIQVIINLSFIILYIVFFWAILISGLSSPPDPYQNMLDPTSNTTASDTDNTQRLLWTANSQYLSLGKLLTNRLLQNNSSVLPTKGFPHHLAVSMYFVSIVWLISLVFFVAFEFRKSKTFEYLKKFEEETISGFQKRCNQRISMVANHEKITFCCSKYLSLYHFRFNLKIHGDDLENSILTGNSNTPVFGNGYQQYNNEDSIDKTIEENEEKYGNVVLTLNKQLEKI